MSHFIIDKIAQAEAEVQVFEYSGIRDWVLLIVSCFVILLCAAVLFLANKVRALSTVLVLSSLAKAAKGESELSLTFTTTAVNNLHNQIEIPPWSKALTDLFPTELLILFAIIIIIMITIGRLIQKHQRSAQVLSKTRVSLLAGNSNLQFLIPLTKAIFQPEMYELLFRQIRPSKVTLKIRATFSGQFCNELKLTNAVLTLENKNLPFTTQIDTKLSIPWYTARKLELITKHDFFPVHFTKRSLWKNKYQPTR